MAFGTDNLQYGEDLGGTAEGFGSTIYDEYMGDTILNADVETADYLYEYDPLKEQNLLADYMSGLTDMGDKTEGVRTKAISERKALSKSIRGGLNSGSMESIAGQQKDDASRAQASLYRSQASSKRALGENIGSLRESYEGDIASSVEAYNTAVGGDGATVSQTGGYSTATTAERQAAYESHYSAAGNSSPNWVKNYEPSGDKAGNDGWNTEGDTWFDTSTGNWWKYEDDSGDWNTESWHAKGAPPASWY